MKNWRERVDEQTKQKVIEEMRNWLEVQFKHKMYNDPCFPYYHAMGRQNVFQNFVDKNVGNIGTLHLGHDLVSLANNFIVSTSSFLQT